MKIQIKDIQKDLSSYVDPNGYVFSLNNNIYRAIKKEKTQFYNALFSKKIIKHLIDNNNLVDSEITDLEIDDPMIGLILKHQKIEPVTYCNEWCPSMLYDAAKVTIDLLNTLLKYNLILQDAYPWNILFEGTKPIFIDFTSIAKIENSLLWPAYDQFLSFFLHPLKLTSQGKANIARMLLYDNIKGIPFNEFYKNTVFLYKLTHPFERIKYFVDNKFQKNTKLRRLLIQQTQKRKPIEINNWVRANFYKKINKNLFSSKNKNQSDIWTTYYENIGREIDKEVKVQIIHKLLKRINPKTVVDLGSNTGVFSIMAAELNARVISIDSSIACIDNLYLMAKNRQLNITPIVSDLLCTTPSYGFMGIQYPSLIDRCRSDLVLCLAIMHHLHITGRQSFERITQLLDSLSKNFLIFEFVSKEDDNNLLIGAGRPINYSLSTVSNALSSYFGNIDIFDSDRPTRKILLCSKSKR